MVFSIYRISYGGKAKKKVFYEKVEKKTKKGVCSRSFIRKYLESNDRFFKR